jgi:hypothetical protein
MPKNNTNEFIASTKIKKVENRVKKVNFNDINTITEIESKEDRENALSQQEAEAVDNTESDRFQRKYADAKKQSAKSILKTEDTKFLPHIKQYEYFLANYVGNNPSNELAKKKLTIIRKVMDAFTRLETEKINPKVKYAKIHNMLQENKDIISTPLTKHEWKFLALIERFIRRYIYHEKPRGADLISKFSCLYSKYKIEKKAKILRNNEGDRVVLVIGKYPFYTSTGKNSGESDTWFPFCGFTDHPNFPAFVKPTPFPPGHQLLTKHYPLKFIEHIDEVTKLAGNDYIFKLLQERFGNFESLCISMLLGGGFWNKPNGKALSHYLQTNFSESIKKIALNIPPDFKKLIASAQLIEFSTAIDHSNIPELNNWLIEQGADITIKNIANNFNYPGVRFSNSSF